MGWGFYAGLVLLGGFLLLIVGVSRQSARHAAAEEREGFERRQKEAIIADQERADEIAERADRAATASRREPAAVRLRKAGRLRETGK